MKQTRYRILLAVLLVMGVISVGVIMAGCAPKGPVEPVKSPRQVWIEAHPTHAGPNGECLEQDDEPCDEDPHDLDDMTEYDKHGYTKAPSPKVSKKPTTKTSPRPATTRRR